MIPPDVRFDAQGLVPGIVQDELTGRVLMLGIRSSLTFWEIFPTVVIERIFDLGFLDRARGIRDICLSGAELLKAAACA